MGEKNTQKKDIKILSGDEMQKNIDKQTIKKKKVLRFIKKVIDAGEIRRERKRSIKREKECRYDNIVGYKGGMNKRKNRIKNKKARKQKKRNQ